MTLIHFNVFPNFLHSWYVILIFIHKRPLFLTLAINIERVYERSMAFPSFVFSCNVESDPYSMGKAFAPE